MRLRTRYWLTIGVLHALLIVLVFQLLYENTWLFILGELFLVVSLGLSYSLYTRFISPIEFVSAGVEAIKAQDFQVKYMPVGFKEMDSLIKTYNEMIDHLRSERVRNSEQHFFFQKLVEKIPAGILVLDFDDQIASSNIVADRFLEAVDTDQHTLGDLLAIPIGTSKVHKVGSVQKYKVESAAFSHMGFQRRYFIIHDLTIELLANEKESYGKVIRMMAHEVNNTIGPVNSIMESVASSIASEHEELISSLEIAQQRNDDMGAFMRNFADLVRVSVPSLEIQNLAPILKDLVEFYRPILTKDGIQIDLTLEGMDHQARFDPLLMRQVLINVIKNAQESILEKGRVDGLISIALTDDPVVLTIKDNGIGIASDIKDKLFTPFFSTKDTGQGIGLTFIRDILLKHEVAFDLLTEGAWTTFKIDFGE